MSGRTFYSEAFDFFCSFLKRQIYGAFFYSETSFIAFEFQKKEKQKVEILNINEVFVNFKTFANRQADRILLANSGAARKTAK